jgi:RNA polymerase sigma factor (sigma-70 family)
MTQTTLGEVLGYLRKACAADGARDLTDGELLERFLNHREEAAFTLLLQRYGPMVLGVCRRALGDAHAAEDCFQATFLVLVRRAASLHKQQPLGSWLYGVAQRIAVRARAQTAVRRDRERRAGTMRRGDSLDKVTWQELRSMLDEEIGRLPEKYRTPIILCYLGGKSYDQAARLLDCPKSSLAQRLTRARQLLRGQLNQRGIALAAATLATVLAEQAAGAALPALLTINTVKAATSVIAGKAAPAGCISRQAFTLAEEAVKPMLGIITKSIVSLLAVCLALVGGITAVGALAEEALPAVVQETQAPPNTGDVPGQAKKDTPALGDRFGDPVPEGARARLGGVRFRHGFITSGVAFAPDGKVVVSAGSPAGVCVWDVSTGRLLRRLSNPDFVQCVALSPDGKSLIAAAEDVQLIDLASGKELRKLQGPMFLSLSVAAFSPDGRTVAAGETRGARAFGDKGSKVILWDSATGKTLHNLDGHEDVNAVAFSPKDGKTLASASSDTQVRLWDVASGKLLRTLEGHTGAVWSVAFAPGGQILASAGEDSVVRLWQVDTGKELRPLKGHQGEIRNLVFSPDGALLASRGVNGSVHLWDPATGKELRRWDAGGFADGALAFSPDGKVLASAGGSCIRLWDPATGQEIHPAAGHTSAVSSLQFAPDGKALFSFGFDWRFLQWDLTTAQANGRLFDQPQAASGHRLFGTVDFSPGGKILAQAYVRFQKRDNSYTLWDTATGKEILALDPGRAANYTGLLRFSPDGKLLASTSNDGVRLWDLTTGKLLHFLPEEQRSPCFAFSPDGKVVAFGGNPDQTIGLWEVATGKVLRRWKCPDRFVRNLAFAPDGKSILSHGDSRATDDTDNLRVWEGATGKLVVSYGVKEKVHCLALSPGGRILAFGTEASGALHLLEVYSGQEIRKITMPQGSIWSLAFAPDGRTLATGGGDATILLWDLAARGRHPKLKPDPLTAADLDRLWSELAADAGTADRALATLTLAPKRSVPFLQERLRLTPAPAEQLAKLIADLDSKSFAVRDKATRGLEELGDAAEGSVRKTLAGNIALELRQRLEAILEKRDKLALRPLRAIDGLQEIGTGEARQVLEALAKGAPNPRVAQTAAAALQRLPR